MEKNLNNVKTILTGGGTGGHVYPALAIYQILKQQQITGETVYIGIRGRAEEKIVPGYNIPIQFVNSAQLSGIPFSKKFKAILTVIYGTLQAVIKLLNIRPKLVIGAGGYASAPVIFAAFLLKPFLKLKIILQEQNLIPGLMNKTSSLIADIIFISNKNTNYFMWNNRCVYSGYPVREELVQNINSNLHTRRPACIPENAFVILIAGGSYGARSINRAVVSAMLELSKDKNLFIVHSIGLNESGEYNAYNDTVKLLRENFKDNFNPETCEVKNSSGTVFYKGFRYIDNIEVWLKSADIVICRGGAGSIAEVSALGKTTVIIPKRGLPGDHQEINAISICEKKACEIIFELYNDDKKECYIKPDYLTGIIRRLVTDPALCKKLGENIRSLFFKDFKSIIASSINNLLNNKEIPFLVSYTIPQFVQFQLQFDTLIRYLDRIMAENDTENLYYKFYKSRIDLFLKSKNYTIKNKAVKLIGTLKQAEYYPDLIRDFSTFQGYLRRNTLHGFCKADSWHPVFKEAVEKGLYDSYYEVRREAVNLFIRFHKELSDNNKITERILELARRRFESFEVKGAAIKASIFFLTENIFFVENKRFTSSPNIKLRQDLLQAICYGMDKGRLTDTHKIKSFVEQILITTSDFRPDFYVREKYREVLKRLDKV